MVTETERTDSEVPFPFRRDDLKENSLIPLVDLVHVFC